MPNDKLAISRRDAEAALEAYDIGPVLFVRPGAGTANRAVIVVTKKGQYFFKLRNPRYSSRGQLIFDHEVIRRLHQAGLPVTPPVRTRNGSRWLQWEKDVYELYPLIEGDDHVPGNLEQIRAAGAVLGGIHRRTESLDPGDGKKPVRLHAPAAIVRGLRWAFEEAGRTGDGDAETRVRELMDVAEGLSRRLPDAAYWALPQCIIHGDYHPANLKFSGSDVVGVFDFDWVGRGPRMVDVADGVLFLGGERSCPTDAGDIVALTQSFNLRQEWIGAFGAGYGAHIAPELEELKALPDLLRCRWLFCRVDAMERKVAPEEKLSYLLQDITEPLRQIDALDGWLTSGAWLTQG